MSAKMHPSSSSMRLRASVQATTGRTFTPQELSMYDGTHEALPIYVALRGIVFDVTSNRKLYGPGGQCHPFAGKDASYAYGKSARGMAQLTSDKLKSDTRELNDEELEALETWVAFYETAYKTVGTMNFK